MSSRTIQVSIHRTALKQPFTISRGSKTHAETVRVEIAEDGVIGRGECVPYGRYGETVEGVRAKITGVAPMISVGCDRTELPEHLSAGAARCAVDCALWDLAAKTTGQPVWKLANLAPPRPIETAETLSLDTPERMGQAATRITGRLLKLKLGGAADLARIEAVHRARPDARLIVDANEGLAATGLDEMTARATELGVVLIEQPLPAGADATLVRGTSPVPLCADESVHTAADIPGLAVKYDAVNVKLDKSGGLTAALDLIAAAKAEGMLTMVGCMVAGSLSMAPAVLAAQLTDFADLDGPLWLKEDLSPGLQFSGGMVPPPDPALWGG
ncbi:MAG: N-acetyl-D-Glu racemase DgcA [Pseudomonadota bacterium]